MLRKALRALDGAHAALVQDVVDGKRFFWLGSGVSLQQVPDVVQLAAKALQALRDRSFVGPDEDANRRALITILDRFLPGESVRFAAMGGTWEPLDLEPLRNSYSEIFSVRVDGQPSEYMLMQAADLPNTYGSPTLQPGPDHLYLAVLIAEGVLRTMASGNWDGLVEAAVLELTAQSGLLDVYVAADDARADTGFAQIAKFHGCAVLARTDPARYADKIIATPAQISRFDNDASFEHMRALLKERTGHYRSLVLGLSVQDSDLLGAFTRAAESQPWPWDPDHPAYVFAEPSLRPTQVDVLENCYRAEFETDRAAIVDHSAFGTFARPLLAGLVLEVLKSKVLAVLGRQSSVPVSIQEELADGVQRVASQVSASVGHDDARLLTFLTEGYAALLRQYFGNQHFPPDAKYISLARGTRSQVEADPTVTLIGADLFALAIGFLGWGDRARRWRPRLASTVDGRIVELWSRLTNDSALVAVVRGAAEADAVLASNTWATGARPMAILHMQSRPRGATRSTASRLGAGRRFGRRHEIWWCDLVEHAASADEIADRFYAGVGL